jgi:hypothetical protein
MTANYELRVYDTSGVLQQVITDWVSLSYSLRINSYGNHQISIVDVPERVDAFVKDAIIVVLRKTARHDWYREYVGLHRSPRHQLTEFDKEIFTSYGRTLEDLLRRPLANAYPNFNGVPGETAMKQLVNSNAGPAPTLGKKKIHKIAPDSAQGTPWYGDRERPRLLDAIKEISAATGVDFNVVLDLTNGVEFEFRTYWPQLGDVTTIPLGPRFGNVKLPDYTHSATEEINTVIVYSSGPGATVIVQDQASADESPWNDIETAIATTYPLTTYRRSQGDAELQKLMAQDNFTFEVVQTDSAEYGLDYKLGDIVRVSFNRFRISRKVVGVDVTVAEGKEDIRVQVATFSPMPTFYDIISGLAGRIKRVEEQL